jgi:hypothetical protein
MNFAFRSPVTVLLFALLLSSCKKKETAEVILHQPPLDPPPPSLNVQEQTDPLLERPPASDARISVPPPASHDAREIRVPPPSGPGASATPPSRLDELAASDTAYEAWFAKHHLNLNQPAMLDEDPDGDGATNRDEFMADTNPNDPNSRPGVHKAMRLKKYTEVRLPVVLEGVDGQKARIRRTDEESAKGQSVSVGENVRGMTMKVTRVESRQDSDKDGRPVDRSRVTLEDPASKERVVLVKDMPARTAGSNAVLTSEDGTTTLTVKVGDTFQWPSEPGATYKVIDLREDQVVVQQLETQKMWTVPKQ